MSRYRVIIQPRARAEVIEGFRWIAERSPGAAARWYGGSDSNGEKNNDLHRD